MRRLIRGLPLLVLAMALPSSANADSVGCHPLLLVPAEPEDHPMIMVDGNVGLESFEDIPAEQVHSIQVLCWDPTTGRFAEGGVGVVSILTKATVESALAALELLLEAQDLYLERNGGFVVDVSAAELASVLEGTDMRLEASPDGWAASIRLSVEFYECHVFDGDAMPPRQEMTRRVIYCALDTDAVLPVLRDYYESAVGNPPRDWAGRRISSDAEIR